MSKLGCPYCSQFFTDDTIPTKCPGCKHRLKVRTIDTLSLREIKIQVACGSLKFGKLASIVRCSPRSDVVTWATRHSRFQVREAAYKNWNCPLFHLLKAAILDIHQAKRIATEAIDLRRARKELKELFDILELELKRIQTDRRIRQMMGIKDEE